MENINVLIVEDELIVSEEIKEIVEKNGYAVCGQAMDSITALASINETIPDIVLMDINIKGSMDGIALANEILTKIKPAIIFLTAYYDSHFIERAKLVKPAAYLVKPFDEKNLVAAIEIAFNNLGLQSSSHQESSYKVNDAIFFKHQSRFSKFSISDILFVKAEGSYVNIVSVKGKTTLALNMKQFEMRLSDPRFIRVHRSYLINIDHVSSFMGNTIYIQDEAIPIAAESRDGVMKRFKLI